MSLPSPTAPTGESPAALFSAYPLGPIALANRMVMAPMTRSRADADAVPNPLAATYYAQRASAGLIVTEAVHATPDSGSYRTPGIHSQTQVAAWARIVEAVHRAGGKIFVQLWHTGRSAHPDLRRGAPPVAPSAISAGGDVRVADNERKPRVVPHALDASEIRQIVEDFHRGAKNAAAAGFDGVELHGANGYLIDQFTRDGSNRRTDEYGGSTENRARFGLEVTRAVIDAIGAQRVGYRISPTGSFNAMSDSDPVATFTYLAGKLSGLGIAYLHVVDPVTDATARVTPLLRPVFGGTYIVCGGFDRDSAERAIASGETDLVAFGAPFLANPDLPRRYALRAPLNEGDRATYYTAGARGYTDYPFLP